MVVSDAVDLCIVIPAHNEADTIGDQLNALSHQRWTGSWEIIVVDNGSTDGTATAATHPLLTGRLRVIRATNGASASYARNVGTQHSQAAAFAFCDADDLVGPSWVQAIGDALRKCPIVTGPNELDRLNPSWLADSRGRGDEASVGTFHGIFPCVRGNNFGVRREVWEALGGLDESVTHCEDLEFSMRAWKAGYEIFGAPDAFVHYRYRTTISALWNQGFNYGRQRPGIVRRLRELELATPSRFVGWKSWIKLVFDLPTLATATGRRRWAWTAGNRAGHLVGSINYRTVAL